MKKENKMKRTTGEKIFVGVNGLLLLCFAIACLYPLIYVLSASLSSVSAVMKGEVWLFPKGVNLGAYREVLDNKMIWSGYGNAIFITFFGTIFSTFMVMLGAYPLSKKRLVGRKGLNFAVALTLWFGGGMIPAYLNFVDLGLLNTRFAIIISAVSTYHVIIMRTFFMSIPESLEESAFLDGASSWKIFTKIYIPLSKPCIATIALMVMIGHWNSYIWPLLLIRKDELQPLQVVLKKIILDTTFGAGSQAVETMTDSIQNYTSDMMVYATIVVSMIPMLCIYPFAQKYFKDGIMLGAVKG